MLRSIRGEYHAASLAFQHALDCADDELTEARILASAAIENDALAALLQARPDEAQRLRRHAETLVKSGDPTEAVAVYTAAIQRSPTDAALRLDRGRLLAKSHRWLDSLDDLVAGTASGIASLEDIALRAEAYEYAGRWPEAVADRTQLYEANPHIEFVRHRLLAALLANDQQTRAIEVCRRRYQDEPDDGMNWLWMGPLLIRTGDLDEYDAFRREIAARIVVGKANSMEQILKASLLTPTSSELLNLLPIQSLTELVENSNGPEVTPENKSWLQVYGYWAHAALALAKLRQGESEAAATDAAAMVRRPFLPRRARILARSIECLALAQQGEFDDYQTRMNELTRQLQNTPVIELNDQIAKVLLREAQSIVDAGDGAGTSE